jgi:hypothetical protein
MGARWLWGAAAAAAMGCTQGSSSSSSAAPAASSHEESLGRVMVDVGRRFEIAGRAAAANRWELAAFEAGELGETFEEDVPAAELPKEGRTAHIPAMAKAFAQTSVPELSRAAAAKDRAAFATAYARAAAQCNGCHEASEKPFIHVATEPGKSVPDLDPLPAPPGSAPSPSR